TRQVMFPHRYHPYFKDNPAIHEAREVAAQILRCSEPKFVFSMMITKPPMHMKETPWHQDHAYDGEPFAPAGSPQLRTSMQFWVALDDVDVANGCMHFLPGYHLKPLLEHYVASGEPTAPNRLLAIKDIERQIDLRKAAACPLKAGGCTIHYYGTPH